MRTVRSHRRGRRAATPAVVAPAILTVALLATAVVSVQVAAPVTAAPAADAGTPVTTLTVASSPGWRVVATIGPKDGQTTGMLTATNSKLAWSVWKGTNFTAVEIWIAGAWQRIALPARFDSYVRSAVAFGGENDSDFWLFNSHVKTQALRWTGATWKLQTIPSWVVQGGNSGVSAAVFGPGNVWVFSLGAGAFAAHYNGLGWTKVKLPAVPTDVTGLDAGDIWALAAQVNKAFALHWNGRTWSKTIIPGTAHIPDGFGPLVATGPKNAWAWRTELLPGPHTVADVLHWNGTSWKKVAGTPADIVNSAAPDGAGGLWASGVDVNPGGFDLFYHLAGGHWTQVSPPVSVWNHAPEYLTWIPGTRSLWGVANGLTPKGVIDTVILKYGP
jgi:hypothetical protein